MDDFDDVLNADLNRYLDTLEEQQPEPDPDWSDAMYEREKNK